MIQSIFCDFCELKETDTNLIETIVIQHFNQDLIDMSKDRVVNVRISLAEAFYQLHKTLDKIEVQQLTNKEEESEEMSMLS